MREKLGLFVAALVVAIFVVCSQQTTAAQPAPPDGYSGPLGPIPLNPAHQDTEGSDFTQDCTNAVPPPAPGGVLWHFILPQSVAEFVAGGTPGNIFAQMTVTFATAGPVTVVFPSFGPPSGAHAWVYTATNDTLQDGLTTFFRENALLRSNEPQFNLSHTCFVPPEQTTTTTSAETTTTTTVGTTTTTIAGEITSTTADPAVTTTTSPVTTSRPSTSIGGAGGGATTTVDPVLPVTGSENGFALAALVALTVGVLLAVVARRRA